MNKHKSAGWAYSAAALAALAVTAAAPAQAAPDSSSANTNGSDSQHAASAAPGSKPTSPRTHRSGSAPTAAPLRSPRTAGQASAATSSDHPRKTPIANLPGVSSPAAAVSGQNGGAGLPGLVSGTATPAATHPSYILTGEHHAVITEPAASLRQKLSTTTAFATAEVAPSAASTPNRVSFLGSLFGVTPSGTSDDAPAAPTNLVTTVLASLFQDVQNLFGRRKLPGASITDASLTEGNSGTTDMAFTVTLSKSSTTPVTISYATANGTATAGQDYTASSGTLTFAPGVTSQQVKVAIIGDTTVEPNETFTVTLSKPSGATIVRATATGTILNDDVATGTWGKSFFAPYVDMGAYPVANLLQMSQTTGTSLMIAGFMMADSNGNPAWSGLTALEPNATNSQEIAINQSIAAFKAAGGDVAVSFGGPVGTTLDESYAARGLSAQALANAYAGVLDTYQVNHLDLDIEGSEIDNSAALALTNAAVKILQQARPDLQVSYTLAVSPTGLYANDLACVQSALAAGVKPAMINVMAMDFGEAAAPTSGPNAQTMGTYTIRALQATYAQLVPLYAKYGQTFTWGQLGVTPMIGVNDVTTEVFNIADAQALENFANSTGLGMISMYSINRDTPGTSYNTTGTTIPQWSFSDLFSAYGTTHVIT